MAKKSDLKRKIEIYLDTSVPNAYLDDTKPERQRETIEFWKRILASWNYRHLVKLKTKRAVNALNLLNGYNTIEIVDPSML